MSNFPTDFSAELVPLREIGLNERGQASLDRIHARGFTVYSGIREVDAPDILEVAEMGEIPEYCPNDLTRFNKKWLEKGRGAFQMRHDTTDALHAYAWGGPEHDETTTAFRSIVKGTGLDLVIATVEALKVMYDVDEESITLETWASNPAVKTYINAGVTFTGNRSEELNKETGQVEPVMRPTLKPRKHDVYDLDTDTYSRYDTRLFARFLTTRELEAMNWQYPVRTHVA